MRPTPLPNYLLSNRKRLGLSQAEVAYLLGVQGSDVCRHERFSREPNVTHAVAYEIIFTRAVSEIFSGLYQKTEQDIASRAKALVEKLGSCKPTRQNMKKRETLANLAAISSNKFQ